MWNTKDAQLLTLTEKIETLSRRVAELKGEREQATEELGLSTRVVELQRQKTKLEIELDRVKETHAREQREIDHKLGLHRTQVTQEIELAKREQVVTLREEALSKQQERFEEEMKFTRERMQGEIDRLSGLTTEILERLPVVKFERSIRETVGSNGHTVTEDE